MKAPPVAIPENSEMLSARTVRGGLAELTHRLEAAGAPAPGLAAEMLILSVLGHARSWLYAYPEHPLSAEERSVLARMLVQCAAGAPIQHLTGRQEFWGLEFDVTPEVLIPRPETEHVIEVALEWLRKRPHPDRLRVADVGTGSGCIAIALAHEVPQANVVATDISAQALEVALRNAAVHGVTGSVEFVETNLLDAFLVNAGAGAVESGAAAIPRFDMIVSNPPYVALRDASMLQREVRDHEPAQALFAGEDGLALYPALIAQAAALLEPGGLLALEVGDGQSTAVRGMLDNLMWCNVAVARDLAGIERVVSAERAAGPSA